MAEKCFEGDGIAWRVELHEGSVKGDTVTRGFS